MAPCIMAQTAGFKPPGPFHLDIANGHPQTRSQDLVSILKEVVIDQDGNDNPSHHTVLLLMDLRANLENRHNHPDARREPEPNSVVWAIDEAMHLSLQFLQKMTDLNGNFKPLVTASLHLAKLILHTVDTSELGDPDAVATIKQMRKEQQTGMYRLRERWEDLLQTADDHDESATFERLSNIMDYTEDYVNDAWFDAKSFMCSCEELIRYRLDDTFLPDTYASTQSMPPPANHRAQTTPRENPEQTESQQPTITSGAGAAATNTIVTGHSTPQHQTPTLKTTPDGHNSINNDKATTTESIPKHKENTPTHDLNNAQQTAVGRHLSNFSMTLTTQTRRVDDAITEITQRVENGTMLAKVRNLATITDESAKEAAHLVEQPASLKENEQGNAPPPSKKKQDRPVFFPTDRGWYYLGARDAPTVRQIETVQRPSGVYIGPFTSPLPVKNTTNQDEDHNWRRKKETRYQKEVAISEGNWPKSETENEYNEYINKQHRHNKSVANEKSRRADGRNINKMDGNTRRRFEALQIPERIEIRNIPDEEPPRPYQGPGQFEAPWRPRPNPTIPSATTNNEIRRVMTEQEPSNHMRGIRPPRPRDTLNTSYDEDTTQYLPPIRGETREEMWKTPHPAASRISRGNSSPPTETQPGPRQLRNITNIGSHDDNRHPSTAIRVNPRQSSSSSPEDPRPPRGAGFQDILIDEPILMGSNPRAHGESSEDSQDNATAVAALLEYGRSIREENVRDRSTDSSSSSAGDTTRTGRPRVRGLGRPRSYIVRDEVYVGPTDVRDIRQDDTDYACQWCKDGSRCWCPIREDLLPDNNGRTPKSRQLGRCRSCRKQFVILGNSRQKCCGNWVTPKTPQASPER